jgi:hypothetical protein
MLRVEKLVFTNIDQETYEIKGTQLESFPITGGEEANVITSRVWNQHGSTFINAFMEPYEGELVFTIHTAVLTPEEIADKRLTISDFFNPLNDFLTMELYLNNGRSYKRDITLVSAPIFPIGLENRNKEWFKVQLLYSANNPFWYSSSRIINSFQGVEPLFSFPFAFDTPLSFGNILPDNLAYNEGHVEAPVTIRITGACVNPVITNTTTGEFIKFKDLTMISSDVLEIDTTFGQKKVLLNGDNVFNKLDFSSTFFNLKKGGNEINFTDETGSTEATILFIYRNLFITI